MTVYLPEDRMPEAEVALLLAVYLLDRPGSSSVAEVAIDGAQVRVGDNEIFPITDYLSERNWTQVEQRGSREWQGVYERDKQRLVIHARPGVGDVVATVGSMRLRAECKGGPLITRPGSREYRILWGVLGQLLTVEHIEDDDIMVAALPFSPKFSSLADRWRNRPLVINSKIEIVLIHRDGTVEGLNL
jgi:hypothetical protein